MRLELGDVAADVLDVGNLPGHETVLEEIRHHPGVVRIDRVVDHLPISRERLSCATKRAVHLSQDIDRILSGSKRLRAPFVRGAVELLQGILEDVELKPLATPSAS